MNRVYPATPLYERATLSPTLPTYAGWFLSSAILMFGVMGVVVIQSATHETPWLRYFDLDRELTVPMLFSTVLLWVDGALAFALVRRKYFSKVLFGGLASFFVFMGLDECLKFHETVEKVVGVDWQIIYLPLIVLAGFGWLRFWWRSFGAACWLWFLGASAWVVSQLIEAAQWRWWWSEGTVKSEHYNLMMVTEELLEMTGSALFLVALLMWLCRFTESSGAAKRSA